MQSFLGFVRTTFATIFALVFGFLVAAFAVIVAVSIPVGILALMFVVARATWHFIVR
jgi:hypothetical protein